MEKLLKNGKTIQQFAEECRQQLISQGFIFNENYGWEKPEILEKFGLNPNMRGIPSVLCDEMEYKEKITEKRDAYGKKTGEKIVETIPHFTGKKIWGIASEWLNYKKYKFASDINTPRDYDDLEYIDKRNRMDYINF